MKSLTKQNSTTLKNINLMVKNNRMVEKDELSEEKILQFNLDHQTDLRQQLQLYYKTVKQSDKFQQLNVDKNEGQEIDYKRIKKSSNDQTKIEHEEDHKECKKNSYNKMGHFPQSNYLQQNTNLDKNQLKKESFFEESLNCFQDKNFEKSNENIDVEQNQIAKFIQYEQKNNLYEQYEHQNVIKDEIQKIKNELNKNYEKQNDYNTLQIKENQSKIIEKEAVLNNNTTINQKKEKKYQQKKRNVGKIINLNKGVSNIQTQNIQENKNICKSIPDNKKFVTLEQIQKNISNQDQKSYIEIQVPQQKRLSLKQKFQDKIQKQLLNVENDSPNSKKDIKRLEKRKENLRKLDQILKQKQRQKDKKNEANKNAIGEEIQQFNIKQKKFSSLEEQNYTQNMQINFSQNIQSHEHDEQQIIQQKKKQVQQDHSSQFTTQDIKQQLENLYKKQQMFQQQQQEIAEQQKNLVANYLQMDQFQFNYQNTNQNQLKHNNAQINQNFNNQQQQFCFQPYQQIIYQQYPYINQNIQYQQPVQDYLAYQQQYQKYRPYQNCTQQPNLLTNLNDINYNSYQSNSIIDNFSINNINSELSQAHDFKNQIITDKNSDKSSGKTERSNKKIEVLTDNNVSKNIHKQKQDIQLNKNFLQTIQQNQDIKILQKQNQINDDEFLSHDQNFSDILAKNQQLENDEEDIFNLQIQGKDETKNLLRNIGNAFKNFIESSQYKPIINKMLGNNANLYDQFLIWVKFNSLESFQTYRNAFNVQQQISSIDNLEEIFQLYGSKYDNFDWEILEKDIQKIQYIVLKEFQFICEKLILISKINQVGFNQESLDEKLENDIITAFQNIVIILGMIFVIIQDESFQNYLASNLNLIEESLSLLNESCYRKNDLVYMQQVFPEKLDQVVKKQNSTFIDTNSDYQKEADKNIYDLEKFKNNFNIEKIALFKVILRELIWDFFKNQGIPYIFNRSVKSNLSRKVHLKYLHKFMNGVANPINFYHFKKQNTLLTEYKESLKQTNKKLMEQVINIDQDYDLNLVEEVQNEVDNFCFEKFQISLNDNKQQQCQKKIKLENEQQNSKNQQNLSRILIDQKNQLQKQENCLFQQNKESQNKLNEQFQLNQQINGKKNFSKSQAVKLEETYTFCKSKYSSNMEVESTKQEKQTEQNNKQQISVLKEQIDKILKQFEFKRQEQ